MVDESKDVSRFRLDPKDFPGRIGVEVPEEVLAYLHGSATGLVDPSVRSLPPLLSRALKNLILSSLVFK